MKTESGEMESCIAPNVIKSISFDQHEIIRNILTLHCEGKSIDLDMTFGNGRFYQKGIERPKLAVELNFELAKKYSVICASCLHLPFADDSQEIVMLDGPYGVGSGPSLNEKVKGQNITPGRFGCFRTGQILLDFYREAIKEAFRVTKPGGRLIQKIQGVVGCGKQWTTHIDSVGFAREVGFRYVDEFLLLAKARPISGKIKKQRNARKYHSFFYVFGKDS